MSAEIDPREAAARALKVAALRTHVDRLAVERGIDPIGRADLVLLILKQLNSWGWKELAQIAGVNAPSLTSQRALLRIYADRFVDARRP